VCDINEKQTGRQTGSTQTCDTAMRPSLTGSRVVNEVLTLLAQRDELHQKSAWKTLNINTMSEPLARVALRVMVGQ
jgi:hypothetical protein